MAGRKPSPLFLERPNYARRRIRDAARTAPLLGGLLVMLPLLWPSEGEDAISTVSAFLYIFGVWAIMIGIAALLAPMLNKRDED
ncbi:MAG: hypothetical protein AAGA15_10320 [Pseudomonadota bacterium]